MSLIAVLGALVKIVCVVAVMLLTVAYMILAERKVAGWVQDRVGPNRAGPGGILQPFCDGLKLLFKEDYTPASVDKFLYSFGPCLMMALAVAGMAIIPFGGRVVIGDTTIDLQIAQVDIGLLYILAISSLGVYGVVLGAWASNNKYSFIGGLRAAAQMLSYEVPLALAILSVIMLSGTLRLENIVQSQMDGWWNVLAQPLLFIIFLTCIFAETNRLPFDLPECEQELVGGYHTEYSSMRFGMYFLGEYAHIIVASSMAVVLFFGGWHLPGVTSDAQTVGAAAVRVAVFYGKVWAFILFYMHVRWTLPRFRFDQLMNLAWRVLMPMALAILIWNAVVMYCWPLGSAAGRWAQLAGNGAVLAGCLLAAGVSRKPIAAENIPIEMGEPSKSESL